MKWRVTASCISGTTDVPGDKSIAHRAIMLASLAPGRSEIKNLPDGEDVQSTARCMEGLGATITRRGTLATIDAPRELHPPTSPLDAGNSGTTMRLLSGILSGQPFRSCLTGDASLSRRPMGRVIEPLARMGAVIQSHDGHAPLAISPGALAGIDYTLPVASAQVKSAVLLAGMYATGSTSVREPAASRDHTERMLTSLGVPVTRDHDVVTVHGGGRLNPLAGTIPGDLSSAAFLFAGALLSGGAVTVRNVGINPTRAALLSVLMRMGATVTVEDERLEMGEPVGDVTVTGGLLHPLSLQPDEIPLVIDELPVLALLATQANGTTTITGAGELRVKETDRIHAVAESLSLLGADCRELPDGFVIRGNSPLSGTTVTSYGDHRLAMMLAVAGTIARGEVTIHDAEASAVSYPQFAEVFSSLGGSIDVD